MKTLRLSALGTALLIAVTLPGVRVTRADQVLASPVHDVLDPIVDNGTVQLGINPAGHLNVPGGTSSMPSGSTTVVGLRFIPTNGDATAPGCLCEGWGVANADGTTGTFSGYANISSDGGVVGLVVQPGTGVTAPTGHVRPESVGSAFKSIVTTTNGRLRVTHSFHPSPSPNLYQVDVTIENIGETPIGALRYRRVMDWDIPPITFQEWVEIRVGNAANVLRATTDGFDSANPLSVLPPGSGSPPTTLVPGSVDYFGGPSDQGALFDFTFGALPAGGTRTFRIYYGAAADRDDALAAIASVGAEVYSLGLPRQAPPSSGAATDGPHAFIFAFSGVGGTSVTNSAPVADSKAVTTSQNTAVPITLRGSDAETAPANFIWTVGTPGHGTLTGTPPNLTYTPHGGYSGPDSFTYTVTDRGSPDGCGTTGPDCAGPLTSEPATVSITVSETVGNHPPTATVTLSPGSPKTNDILVATATKSDADENAVSLTFVWKKTSGETTTTLRTFTTSTGLTDSLDLGVPGNGDRGEIITVEVTPNDGTVDGAVAAASATIVNSPPVLSAANQTGTEGVPLSFQVSATDPDASDSLTVSVSNLPLGATFDATTGTFAWTPNFAQGGPTPYSVQFTVSDGQVVEMKTVSLTIADVPGRPDADGDGVPDDVDNCPADPNSTQADVCHNSPQPTTGAARTTAPGTSGLPVVTYNLTVTATGGDMSWAAPGLLTGTVHCRILDSSGQEVPPEQIPEIGTQVLDEDGGIFIRVPAGQTVTLSGQYDPGLTHPALAGGAYTVECEYRNFTPRPDPQPGDPPVWFGEVPATTTSIFVGGYTFNGFLPPLVADLVVNNGVPVRFSLLNSTGAAISTCTCTLMLQALDDLGNPVGPPFPASGDGPSNVFRYTGNQYEYNLGTSALASGRYQLQALLDDGTTKTINIRIVHNAQGVFFLHGAGRTDNPPTLFLSPVPPTGTVAKFKDSPAVNFTAGNPWKEVGTWSGSPTVIQGVVAGLSPLHVWLGLRNSDDVGTQFDVRAEVHTNGGMVAAGEILCVTGITRNPNNAKEVTVSFAPFPAVTFDGATDALSLKILTRIGTTPSGGRCSGPGGSHSSAGGLRLYFDAVGRNASFGTAP